MKVEVLQSGLVMNSVHIQWVRDVIVQMLMTIAGKLYFAEAILSEWLKWLGDTKVLELLLIGHVPPEGQSQGLC